MAGKQLALGVAFCGVAFAQQPAAKANDHQAPPVTGLIPDHATISVENLDLEAEWYERVLGFKLWHKFEMSPGNINEQLTIPGYRIDLIRFKGSKRPPAVSPLYLQQGWIHVVFHVKDVTKAWRELQALNVEARVVKDDLGNATQLVLHDPEGNEIEIEPPSPDQPN